MVFKKWCCCLPLRMASLILLYIYLIGYVWNTLNPLLAVGDRRTNTLFFVEIAALGDMNLFVSITGGLIFLATIISITKKIHPESFLIVTMSFLILKVIYDVCAVIIFKLNGPNKNCYNGNEFKKIMDEIVYELLLTYIYIVMGCNIAFILYSILVFYSYMVELKENIANDVPLEEKSNPEECHSRTLPPPYTPTLPPPYTAQYDTQRSQCFVNV